MSTSNGLESVRADVRRALQKLEALQEGAVILDKYGHAWQMSRDSWYRLYDGAGRSSWDIAQLATQMTVLDKGRKRNVLGGVEV